MKKFVCAFIAACIVITFGTTSCTYEVESIEGTNPSLKGMKDIDFFIGVPQSTQVSTRAITGSVPENYIENIHVLVFDNTTKELIVKVKGKDISAVPSSTNGNQFTFKATLPVGTAYTFMILANAETYLTDIHTGITPTLTKDDVLDLTVKQESKWNATIPNIPMWAERELNLTATDKPTFELTRMLARVNVDVQLKDDVQGNSVDNFKLTSVRYYNYNTFGALVPGEGNYDATSQAAVLATIPQTPGTKTREALLFSGSEITDDKECKEKIYIFEAAHNGNTYNQPANNSDWIENPCLVIGGKYQKEDGDWLEETFYRVDFIKKDTSDPGNIQDVWLSVLRNFTYNVVITQVSGAGFEDPDIALESAPINMQANILEWNENDMGEIVFDGVFYLSVSRDKFAFGRNEVTSKEDENILYVKTDYIYNNQPNDPKSGWYVEKYVDAADETTPVTWLKLNPDKDVPNNRTECYFTFETNTGSTNRQAIVWIAAGRLRYPVYVTQGIISLDIVDPDDNDKPISEIEFVVPKNLVSQPSRHFKVNWTPVNMPLAIDHESPQSWNPFAPEWLSPNPQTLGWTVPPGGTQTFQVNPPSVSSSDIATDPFYEKQTKYSFTIDNGGETYTKSVNIHQVYYNILVDTYGYRLDGKTYTLSVRSNTDWVITDVEEWLYNQDPATNPRPAPVMLNLNSYDNLRVGTTGGPDVNGTSVAFTVVDQSSTQHLNKWGVVYVTFENPDGKFDPVRVELRFPPKRLRVLGMGFGRDVRGYQVGMSNGYHTNTAYHMLNSQDNFGESSESTVYVRAMDIVGYDVQGVSIASPGKTGWSTAYLREWLNANPDIVVITYSMLMNRTESDLIVKYINNGGAALVMNGGYNDEWGNYAVNFLRSLLGDETISCSKISSLNTESDVYQFPDGDQWKNHPMLDGPFGDIRGKHWGAHERSTGFKTNNQSTYDQIEIINWSQDNMYPIGTGIVSNPRPTNYINHVVAFKHKTKNVIWIGNDTFTASLKLGTFDGAKWDPFTLDAQYRPAVRHGFGRTGLAAYGTEKYDTYNSFAMANMLAWAISVTNHVPPAGGY